jgi:hypothetical protein
MQSYEDNDGEWNNQSSTDTPTVKTSTVPPPSSFLNQPVNVTKT